MEMWEYHKKKPPENIPVAFYPSLISGRLVGAFITKLLPQNSNLRERVL